MSDTEHQEETETIEGVESPEVIAEEQIKYRIVNLNSGLDELNHVINSGDKEAIRQAYRNLTFTFPTAVYLFQRLFFHLLEYILV